MGNKLNRILQYRESIFCRQRPIEIHVRIFTHRHVKMRRTFKISYGVECVMHQYIVLSNMCATLLHSFNTEMRAHVRTGKKRIRHFHVEGNELYAEKCKHATTAYVHCALFTPFSSNDYCHFCNCSTKGQ